jgi:hypothetical protein
MLPERERRILLLRFFGGLTQTEIAAQVGLSQMHVSRLLSRALTRLRRQLATGWPRRTWAEVHDLPGGHALPGMPGGGSGAVWPAPLTAAARCSPSPSPAAAG